MDTTSGLQTGPAMSRRWLGLSVACGVVAIAIILYGYVYSFGRLGMSGWHIALCLFVLLVIALGALAKEQVFPWHSRKLSDWLTWKTLGGAVYTVMLAALSATAVIQLLDPKETAPELIKASVDASSAARSSGQIVRAMKDSGLLSPVGVILSKGLPGVWGERGCNVTYRMILEGNSVTMFSIQSVPRLSPFHQVLNLAPPRALSGGGVSVMAEIVEGTDIGSSIKLNYEKIGPVERLTRIQQSPQRTTTFDRCKA